MTTKPEVTERIGLSPNRLTGTGQRFAGADSLERLEMVRGFLQTILMDQTTPMGTLRLVEMLGIDLAERLADSIDHPAEDGVGLDT